MPPAAIPQHGRMTLAEPPVLRSTTTADFLAAVPALAGFTARNSIVVIPFAGSRTHGAMRMDLPPRETASVARAIGDAIPRLVAQLPGVDGLALVIYTDATFAERHGTPHLELWRGMQRRILRSGLVLREACCVAADGWVSYLEPRRPVDGHPLSEITGTRMALEAAFHAGALPDITAWSTLPDADAEVARRVTTAADDLLFSGERLDSFGVAHTVDLDPVGLAERVRATPASELPASALAEIVATAAQPALRDVLLVALAFGRDAGERTAAQQQRALERQRATGETFDEIVAAENADVVSAVAGAADADAADAEAADAVSADADTADTDAADADAGDIGAVSADGGSAHSASARRGIADSVDADAGNAGTGNTGAGNTGDPTDARQHDDDALLMLGRSRRRPDHDALLAATEALRRAASHAPRPLRAGTLCVLTWMLWAQGTLAAAHRMHELAAEADPELRMVETLDWLLASGAPGWASARG